MDARAMALLAGASPRPCSSSATSRCSAACAPATCSYSRPSLVLANVGNLVQAVYVGLPVGPIWFLHAFYLAASALMLGLHFATPRRSHQTRKGARWTRVTTTLPPTATPR